MKLIFFLILYLLSNLFFKCFAQPFYERGFIFNETYIKNMIYNELFILQSCVQKQHDIIQIRNIQRIHCCSLKLIAGNCVFNAKKYNKCKKCKSSQFHKSNNKQCKKCSATNNVEVERCLIVIFFNKLLLINAFCIFSFVL